MPVCETTDINKQTKIIIFNKPNQTDTWYKYYLYHVSVWFGSSEPLTPSLRAVSSTLGDTWWVVYETFIMVYKSFFLLDLSGAVNCQLRAVSSSSTLGDTRLIVYETFINVINVCFVQTSLLSESQSAR